MSPPVAVFWERWSVKGPFSCRASYLVSDNIFHSFSPYNILTEAHPIFGSGSSDCYIKQQLSMSRLWCCWQDRALLSVGLMVFVDDAQLSDFFRFSFLYSSSGNGAGQGRGESFQSTSHSTTLLPALLPYTEIKKTTH